MQGLEIARDFFFRWGLPYLRREFPELSARIAAGRVFGSDVLGADDELSRDHNWGPQFELFLSADDFENVGTVVSERMNREAPNPWDGHRLAGHGSQSVIVHGIPQWFRDGFSLTHPPRQSSDWRRVPESHLYFLRHAAVWVDESGELSSWRTALHSYPRDIQLSRLSEECFNVWHYGQYNFVERLTRRGDPLAVAQSLGQFVEAVMRLRLLLSGDFTPYWKWLAHEFRKLGGAARYVAPMESLLQSRDLDEQAGLVSAICRHVHQELLDAGVITGQFATYHPMPLYRAHLELKAKAEDG